MARKDDFEDDFLDPDSDSYDFKPVSSSESTLGKSAKIAIAISVIGAGAIGTWLFLADNPADHQNVPVVRAENQDFKQKPDDPGGMSVPNRDKTVYNRLSGENTEPRLERLLPRPEQPLEKPVAQPETALAETVLDPLTGKPVIVSEIPALKEPAKPLSPAPLVDPDVDIPPSASPDENTREVGDIPSEELAEAIEPPKPTSLVAQTAQSQVNDENAPRALLTRNEQQNQNSAATPTGPTQQDQDELVAKIAEALAQDPTGAKAVQNKDQKVAAVAPPKATPPQTVAPKSGFVLQLLSSKSESGVQKSLKQITGKHQDLIGQVPANVVRADLGPEKGIYYRLRLGPIADGNQAKSLCADLKSRKVGCFIVKVQ